MDVIYKCVNAKELGEAAKKSSNIKIKVLNVKENKTFNQLIIEFAYVGIECGDK